MLGWILGQYNKLAITGASFALQVEYEQCSRTGDWRSFKKAIRKLEARVAKSTEKRKAAATEWTYIVLTSAHEKISDAKPEGSVLLLQSACSLIEECAFDSKEAATSYFETACELANVLAKRGAFTESREIAAHAAGIFEQVVGNNDVLSAFRADLQELEEDLQRDTEQSHKVSESEQTTVADAGNPKDC